MIINLADNRRDKEKHDPIFGVIVNQEGSIKFEFKKCSVMSLLGEANELDWGCYVTIYDDKQSQKDYAESDDGLVGEL